MSDWRERKTDETRQVEELLGGHFQTVNAYRYNSASIRVRVIDERFESKTLAEREAMVMPLVMKLPKRIREDILMLIMLAPRELDAPNVQSLTNIEFEQPLTSRL